MPKSQLQPLETAEAALRASEERFRAAIEGGFDAFYLMRAVPGIDSAPVDFALVELNKQGERLLGESRERLLGRTLLQLLPGDAGASAVAKYARVMQTGTPLEEELPAAAMFRVDWIHHQVVAVGDGVAVTVRDVTERIVKDEALRKYQEELETLVEERTADLRMLNEHLQEEIDERRRAEESLARYSAQLEKLNEELEQSNRELDEFAYIASHDLREPLRGISNYASFLIEDYGPKMERDGVEMLEALVRLAQRLDSFISSLLHFSRVGRAHLQFEEVPLQEVLDEVIEDLRPLIEATGSRVAVARPLPVVRADRVRVAEVFMNLISNGMKYNESAEKVVEVGWNGSDDSPARADGSGNVTARIARAAEAPVFYVRDNGIGIREKHLEAIFQLFKRLHGRDKYGGGSGAGLTITKRAVERHGGRLWVESTLGEGSVFYFTLEAR